MNREEEKINNTTAANWHPNAPLNPQTDEGVGPTSTVQAEPPVSRPDSEEPNTQVVPPHSPVAETDDQIEHQWNVAGGMSPEPRH